MERVHDLKFTLHCYCSLPESHDGSLLECDSCRKWYQYKINVLQLLTL